MSHGPICAVLSMAAGCFTARVQLGIADDAGRTGIQGSVLVGWDETIGKDRHAVAVLAGTAVSDATSVALAADFIEMPPMDGHLMWRAGVRLDAGERWFAGPQAAALYAFYDEWTPHGSRIPIDRRVVFAAGLSGRVGASWTSTQPRELGGAVDAVLDVYWEGR